MFRDVRNFVGLLLLLLGLSLATNVALTMKLNSVTTRLSNRAAAEAWSPPRIPTGTKMPPLHVRDQQDEPQVITFEEESRSTVVYVLDPACGWCRRNAANVSALAAQAGPRFRFVGISTKRSQLGEFLIRNPLPFPVYSQPDAEAHSAFQMAGVPRTVVVSPSGELLADFPGAYLPTLQDEVEDYFTVRLPGLTTAEPAGPPAALGNGSTESASQNCSDELGQEFSPGWVRQKNGQNVRCMPDGRWVSID